MGLLNGLMPGEWSPNANGGQADGMSGLLNNPALQMGLGILANNQGNYGSFGAALGRGGLTGMQNLQRQQESMRQQKIMDLHAQQIEAQKAEMQRKAQQDAESKESTLRLLSGDPATYQTMQEQPFTRTENVPKPLLPDAQAPNFNTMSQTVAGVNRVPQFDNNKYMQDVINAGYGNKLLDKQFSAKEPMKLGKGDRLIDPTNFKELVGAAPDITDSPANVREYEYAKAQGFNGSFLDFQLAQKRAGASVNNVSVNTGQKGFDNTLKLRGDFRSEPIYKAHQEVRSAHSQITAALKQASPAGDLAGATKLMKILDPGSVVRESELGMAMAASGAMDRLTNYAQLTLSGQKLTPTQRKDFQALSDSLLNESSKQYNAKRAEYKGISERNGLNEQDVLGNADTIPQKPRDKASILKQYGVR